MFQATPARRAAIFCAAALLILAWTLPGLAQSAPADEPASASDVQAPAAPATATTQKNLLSMIRSGGVAMIPLLSCSFLLTVFVFERAISLRRGRVIPGPFVKRFLHQLRDGQLDRDQALALCDGNGSPITKVFGAAVRKWGSPAEAVDKAIDDAGERVGFELRRYLRVFNAVATVSPLLGLLGTVFGMIHSFSELASTESVGRTEALATGISEALYATATGLSIAIPALVLYWFFASRVDRLLIDIDGLGQDVVQVISAEAQAEAAQAKPARTRRSTTAAA